MNSLLLSPFFRYFLVLAGFKMILSTNSFVVNSDNKSCLGGPNLDRGIFHAASEHWHARGTSLSFSSTPTKPLYDGTNYTFPDTRTSAGVAELLEVSFVHACMQLASGYVDVLKMFIATSIGAYESGFAIDNILEELEENKGLPNTANRPLMDEEKKLRRDWLCVVYLTLAAMGHAPLMTSPLATDVAKESIPDDIKERYGEHTTKVGEAYKNDSRMSLCVESLVSGVGENNQLSPLEKAILLQSLKVATLTPIVVNEAREANGNNVKPPTPPIEGAF